MRRLGHGLLGAFLGAMISVGPLMGFFGVSGRWSIFSIGLILCSLSVAVLSVVFGERLIIFIRDYFLGGGKE